MWHEDLSIFSERRKSRKQEQREQSAGWSEFDQVPLSFYLITVSNPSGCALSQLTPGILLHPVRFRYLQAGNPLPGQGQRNQFCRKIPRPDRDDNELPATGHERHGKAGLIPGQFHFEDRSAGLFVESAEFLPPALRP